MLETILTSIAAFAGTNIDDLFVDVVLFAQADGKAAKRSVVAGKYIGIGILFLMGWLGSLLVKSFSSKAIGFLGLIPIALGIWHIFSKEDSEDGSTTHSKGLLINTALMTLSNGADNIGVYVPLFAGFETAEMIIVAVVFVLMVAVWCCLASKISNLPVLKRFLVRYRRAIIPAVFIGLGAYILLKAFV